MFKISNIVLFVIVALGHCGIIYIVLSSPEKQYEQKLVIAGTILEMTVLNVMEAAPPEEKVVEQTKEAPKILTTEKSDVEIDNPVESLKEKVIQAPVKPKIVPKKNIANQNRNKNTAQIQPKKAGQAIQSQAFMAPTHEGKALGNRKPKYPELSLRRKEEGRVTLKAKVLASGRAESVSIHKSSGYPRLDNAAQKAAQNYRYKPAEQNGQKVSYDYFFTVTFSIKNM
ncbi:energy transducer TonB [Wohlfahrtiimonas larvae]|uniref:TonB C-terminal domain-containing protein n=1 Tax=Wohlfahrtiimonas larvae TaxID=1157986 RepID=A0ABP9MWE4_9GAMM|nr:energy transducer TonB [Wohlfahrtiimonas larvae]